MLPIDEHAKDGNVHLVSGEGWKEPTLAWWYSSLNCWIAQNGSSLPIQPTHYVPMPWLMHAGAMREALIHADVQAAAASEIANVVYDSEIVDEALAATEWPKEG